MFGSSSSTFLVFTAPISFSPSQTWEPIKSITTPTPPTIVREIQFFFPSPAPKPCYVNNFLWVFWLSFLTRNGMNFSPARASVLKVEADVPSRPRKDKKKLTTEWHRTTQPDDDVWMLVSVVIHLFSRFVDLLRPALFRPTQTTHASRKRKNIHSTETTFTKKKLFQNYSSSHYSFVDKKKIFHFLSCLLTMINNFLWNLTFSLSRITRKKNGEKLAEDDISFSEFHPGKQTKWILAQLSQQKILLTYNFSQAELCVVSVFP